LTESGVSEENLAKVLATMPENTALGSAELIRDQDYSGLLDKFADALGDKNFRGAWARIPAEKRAKMDFPQTYKEISKSLERNYKDWTKSKKLEPVHTYSDGTSWQNPKSREELEHEGIVLDHCIGRRDQDYCNQIAAGNAEAFSLRSKDSEPMVTLYVKKQGGRVRSNVEIPQWLQAPDDTATRQAWEPLRTRLVAEQNERVQREIADHLYNIGMAEGRTHRLTGLYGYETRPEDYARLQQNLREAFEGINGATAGDYTAAYERSVAKLAQLLRLPTSQVEVPVKYTLSQIKGSHNRYAHNWTTKEADDWVPKIREFMEKLGIPEDSWDRTTDGQYFKRAARAWDDRHPEVARQRELDRVARSRHPQDAAANARMDNWRPEVANPPPVDDNRLQAYGNDVLIPWREIEAPDGQQMVILDAGEVDGHAYWYEEDLEPNENGIWAAPLFRDGRVDFENRYPLGDMIDVQEFPALGEAIENRFGRNDLGWQPDE
jgi:hypothetical protein